jgi:hypothetical protein
MGQRINAFRVDDVSGVLVAFRFEDGFPANRLGVADPV